MTTATKSDDNKTRDVAAESFVNAAGKGDLKTVKMMLENGWSPDHRGEHGRTALMNAALSGRKEVVEFLISRGADVNAKNEFGGAPLADAVFNADKNIAITNLLIDKGADINATNSEGRTLLMQLVVPGSYDERRLERKETIKLLMEKGVDMNAEDKKGRTALDYARDSLDVQMVDILGSYGVHTRARSRG